MRDIELGAVVGQLDARDEQVVLFVRRVRAQYQPVHRVILAVRSGHIRQPLGRQTRPLEGVGHDEVVEERRVLLPDLVLLVDDALFDAIVETFEGRNCFTSCVYYRIPVRFYILKNVPVINVDRLFYIYLKLHK